jgi:Pyruvate/2-oxoacid:ferredoxin oxidoreductase gamma subunit
MNRPSLEKFEGEVKPGGLIMYDSSLIDISPIRQDVECLAVPATKMADELGSTRIANMLIMGVYMGYTALLDKTTLYESLKTAIKRKRLMDINVKAVDKGFEFGVQNRRESA